VVVYQELTMCLSGLTDFEIWSRFKMGDDQALAIIYTKNSKKLFQYGLKFTPNDLLIADSIQDLFAELIKNRRNLGNTDNILFYLLKSFKRKLLRKLQKENRSDAIESYEDYIFDVTYSIEHDIILEEVSKQKKVMLMQALKELTPRQKEAIYLKFTKELDYKGISEIMDISVEACRNLISNSIKSLKDSIHAKGENPIMCFFSFIKNKSKIMMMFSMVVPYI
jgi:RNA polymerase sigma factor (sigma-70 family)